MEKKDDGIDGDNEVLVDPNGLYLCRMNERRLRPVDSRRIEPIADLDVLVQLKLTTDRKSVVPRTVGHFWFGPVL